MSVKSGLGLKSLRERAQLSSGVLTIGSELGRGTIIAVVWDAAALRGRCLRRQGLPPLTRPGE
ncbi:MAG: hypothetical protein ACLR7Z_04305 [Bilophila wadsworthia]